MMFNFNSKKITLKQITEINAFSEKPLVRQLESELYFLIMKKPSDIKIKIKLPNYLHIRCSWVIQLHVLRSLLLAEM